MEYIFGIKFQTFASNCDFYVGKIVKKINSFFVKKNKNSFAKHAKIVEIVF